MDWGADLRFLSASSGLRFHLVFSYMCVPWRPTPEFRNRRGGETMDKEQCDDARVGRILAHIMDPGICTTTPDEAVTVRVAESNNPPESPPARLILCRTE